MKVTKVMIIIIGSAELPFHLPLKPLLERAKVVMIERGMVGGTCVNVGCVPSKTLLRAGESIT